MRLIFAFITSIYSFYSQNTIRFGIDQIVPHLNQIKGKRVAIMANQSSIDYQNHHLIQLCEQNSINVRYIFAPEHGFKGNYANGEKIPDNLGERIVSLYGKRKSPPDSIMNDIDLVIFDLQDLGLRYYTYIASLADIMEACARHHVALWICDRPNPFMNRISGAGTKDSLFSMVSPFPIPIQYGLSIAELALMIQGEKWRHTDSLNLKILKLENYQRQFAYPENRFISPSPNISDLETVYFYSAFCFLEASNVSEGRGTEFPFKTLAADFFSDSIIQFFKGYNLNVSFDSVIPISIKGKAIHPKYENQRIPAFFFRLKQKEDFNGPLMGYHFIHYLSIHYPDKFKITSSDFLDKLSGITNSQKIFKDSNLFSIAMQSIQNELNIYQKMRQKYLLYN